MARETVWIKGFTLANIVSYNINIKIQYEVSNPTIAMRTDKPQILMVHEVGIVHGACQYID
jgi:hypothetical protein